MTTNISATADTDTVVMRLSGAQGMIAAVPLCLGFLPSHSLVMICLSGPRQRMGPLARIDLFRAGMAGGADTLGAFANRYADEVALVCYHDGPRPDCLDDVAETLRSFRVPVATMLSVSGGRIRDARSKSRFKRDTGIPILDADDDQSVALNSAYALIGRAPLASRADLARSISPAPSDDADLARTAISLATHRLHGSLEGVPDGRTLTLALSQAVDAALLAATDALVNSGAVPLPLTAELIALSSHIGCRDQMLARAVRNSDPSSLPMLIAVAAQCPDESCAQWCSVLAAAAYRAGDGALAQCALDRTQSIQPNHRLARLLRATIEAGLPPSELAALAALDIPVDRAAARSVEHGG